MRFVHTTLVLGLLAGTAEGNEITVYAPSIGGAIDFAGQPRLSQIGPFELEFDLSYNQPVTQSDIHAVSFALGDFRFDDVSVSSHFEGHEYSNGEPINSRFRLHTPVLSLSLQDGDTLLADIEEDGLVAWTIFDPPSPAGPSLAVSGIWLTGIEELPDQDGEPAHAPEPASLLLWACGLVAIIWRRRRPLMTNVI